MPSIEIIPAKLAGEVRVPASKSLLHRGVFCAALAGDPALCALPPDDEISNDIRASIACAAAIRRAGASFDCRESGTTLRLLVPILAALGTPARVAGSGRLPMRPLAEYADAFEGKGAALGFPAHAGVGASPRFLPLDVSGRLSAGVFKMRGDVSSQYISGLLLALPLLGGDSEIALTTPLESAPYVEMTLDAMRHFNVAAEACAGGWRVRGGQRFHSATPYRAEPDFSQAAFWLLARFLGNPVAVADLPQETAQGDSVFARLAGNAGDIDVSACPDLLPALAAAAAFAEGDTRFTNAARLRLKESDRLESTRAMLAAFGVDAETSADSMTVRGAGAARALRSCEVDAANDHRIVMTAAMLATRADGVVVVHGAEAVNKSYPRFFQDYAAAASATRQPHRNT